MGITEWLVPLVGLMEVATVSYSKESIDSRIELKLFVVIKGIPNVRCFCEKNTHDSIKPKKRKYRWQPIRRIILFVLFFVFCLILQPTGPQWAWPSGPAWGVSSRALLRLLSGLLAP